MADPTTITQQIVSESPAIEAYKTNLLKTASDLAYNVNQPSLASQNTLHWFAGIPMGPLLRIPYGRLG